MSWLSSLKSVFSPALEVKQEEVQQVLQSYVLPESTDTLKPVFPKLILKGVFYNSPSIPLYMKRIICRKFMMIWQMHWKNVVFKN